jgi:Arc/MetJ-type ribon-helix-helix transcriptional regulator
MTNGNTQNLAARLAALLQENENESGADFLRASLEKINQRLDQIESRLETRNPKPETRNPQPVHFSQEKFKSVEELADEIIANLENEKACPYEPTAKPCDHCAMCSSRGF